MTDRFLHVDDYDDTVYMIYYTADMNGEGERALVLYVCELMG